jgi:hypothetical protein
MYYAFLSSQLLFLPGGMSAWKMIKKRLHCVRCCRLRLTMTTTCGLDAEKLSIDASWETFQRKFGNVLLRM